MMRPEDILRDLKQKAPDLMEFLEKNQGAKQDGADAKTERVAGEDKVDTTKIINEVLTLVRSEINARLRGLMAEIDMKISDSSGKGSSKADGWVPGKPRHRFTDYTAAAVGQSAETYSFKATTMGQQDGSSGKIKVLAGSVIFYPLVEIDFAQAEVSVASESGIIKGALNITDGSSTITDGDPAEGVWDLIFPICDYALTTGTNDDDDQIATATVSKQRQCGDITLPTMDMVYCYGGISYQLWNLGIRGLPSGD